MMYLTGQHADERPCDVQAMNPTSLASIQSQTSTTADEKNTNRARKRPLDAHAAAKHHALWQLVRATLREQSCETARTKVFALVGATVVQLCWQLRGKWRLLWEY